MAKVAVVIRHLPGCRPVVSTVIDEPSGDIDDLEHYFESRVNEHIIRFKNNFPEFQNAVFYTDIMHLER